MSAALRVFRKTATPRTRLTAEADGLAALRATGTVRVPATIDADDPDGLVLEWLDLRALDARSGARLGVALAALHRAPVPGELRGKFGWHRDNYIGATPQRNAVSSSWTAFWRQRRLGPQLEQAVAAGHGSALKRSGEGLVSRLDALLGAHAFAPALLHGDLWSGNAGALPDGTPVVFDPAVYVGDREADVAMTELFGGFPPAFQAAYRAAAPLDEGYTLRRDVYNLYHLLNHLNLFGAAYLSRCERTIARVLAEVR